MTQPIGPKIVWATKTANTNEQNGTIIILMAAGDIFLKNFSKYTNANPAKIAGMTCAWYPIIWTWANPKFQTGISAAAVEATE